MESAEQERLKYRRQYLLTPGSISCPFLHNRFTLNGEYMLYAHQDLQVTELEKNGVKMVLLGDIFCYAHPDYKNLEILKHLYNPDFDIFLENTSRYSGRFVLLYISGEQINCVTDATATRKVYYSEQNNKIWLGSQPHLLAKILNLPVTSQASKLKFFGSTDFTRLDNASIGNTTYYDDILQLMPNHFLDLSTSTISRFWPNKRINIKPLKEVAEKCAVIVKGYLESIVARYEVMLPITAGNDSRLLLAGTRNIQDRIYYYINRDPELSYKSPDIKVPVDLFHKIKRDFHVVELPSTVNDVFRDIYFQNNPHGSERYLLHIYNYYIKYADKINLPGNFASAPWGINKLKEKNVTPESLAFVNRIEAYDHAVQYYAEWLAKCRDLCEENNMHLVKLFYWEERMANWGTQVQLDKDMAQEDINPFNSRELIELFFSVKTRYNNVPDYILHRRIIRLLWPELLKTPINPSLLNRFLWVVKKMGLFSLVPKIKFKTAR